MGVYANWKEEKRKLQGFTPIKEKPISLGPLGRDSALASAGKLMVLDNLKQLDLALSDFINETHRAN